MGDGAELFVQGVYVLIAGSVIGLLLWVLRPLLESDAFAGLEIQPGSIVCALGAAWVSAMISWGLWALIDGPLDLNWSFWSKLKPPSVAFAFSFPFVWQLLLRLAGEPASDELDESEEELWDCRIGKTTLRELPLEKLLALASVSVLEPNHQVKLSSDDEWRSVSSVGEIASAANDSLDSLFRFECRHCEHGKGMRVPLSAVTGRIECPRCRKSVSADGLVKRQLVQQFGDRNGQKLFAMFQAMGVVAESRPRKATERAFALQCGQCGKKLRLKRRPDVPCVKCPQCDQDIPVPQKKRN